MAVSAPIFYAPVPEGGKVELSREESHHAVKVLRLKAGDTVTILDGLGNTMQGKIVDASSRITMVSITAKEKQIPRKGRLHIGISPPKSGDRFDWFLEKATEIGVEEITPLWSANSERTKINAARNEKIVVSAMKQSRNSYLPRLNDAQKFKDFVSSANSNRKYIAHCEPSATDKLTSVLAKDEDALILIGPEGDFSPSEIELALGHGFQAITMGAQRLRTETAAIVACTIFHQTNYT